MLRIQVQNVAEHARRYFVEGLASDDYYRAGTELPGQWVGLGAERLGLRGPVRYKAFAELTENINPATGDRFTPRKNDDRRIGYDMNFHAPKSVSVAYFLTGDERIREAFTEAVRETMREIEAHMATRVRRGGANHDRVTANMVWAEYIHFTTRPVDGIPDPHLHAHNFVFNGTWDHEEHRWKAGQFVEIVRHAQYFQDAFHARFARRLGDLGLHITPTEFAFELGWVPDGLIERFSRRKRIIETIAEKMGITDAAQKAGLGAKTRERKRDDCSLEELRAIWSQRLTPDDHAWLKSVQEARSEGQKFRETPESIGPREPEPAMARPEEPAGRQAEASRPEPTPSSTAASQTDPGGSSPTERGKPAGSRPDQHEQASQRSEQPRPQEDGPQRHAAGDPHHRPEQAKQSQQAGAGQQARQTQQGKSSDTKQGRSRTDTHESAGQSGPSADPGQSRMGASPREEEADFVSSKPKNIQRPSYSARKAIDIAVRHLMDRESIVDVHQVVRHAMRHSRGRATPQELWAALGERVDLPRKTIAGTEYITTKEAIRQEKRVIDFAVEGRGKYRPLGRVPLSLSALKLTATDLEVMKGLLASMDRVTLLKMTGAGNRPEVVKATLAGIRQADHKVVVLGANATASRHAETVYGLKDVPTVQKYLSEPTLGKMVSGTLRDHVIWVEQAGRLGTKAMYELFELARKTGARLVLSGDSEGLRSSQRGDGFHILCKHAKLRSIEWEVNQNMQGEFHDAKWSIRDQHRGIGEDFVQNHMFRKTPVGAFVHTEAAKRYLEVVKKDHSAVLVGTSREMVKWLNRAVRSELRARGKLKGGDVSVLQLQPTQWTETEKRLTGSYRKGQVIEFHQNTRGFKPGDRTKVVGVWAGQVWVRPRHLVAAPVMLSLGHADRFAVYEPTRSNLSIGDRIEITRNIKPVFGKPLRNRTIRKVAGIVPGTREIILDNGRILRRNFGHFQHAYATSVHGLQGRTVDSVFFAANAHEWKGIGNHHLTAASEAANKRFEIHTDASPKLFEEAVRRTWERMSATDFTEANDDFKQRAEHGPDTEQEEPTFDEEPGRKAGRPDQQSNDPYKSFWEEVRQSEQDEEERELTRRMQQEQEQQQQHARGHTHGP